MGILRDIFVASQAFKKGKMLKTLVLVFCAFVNFGAAPPTLRLLRQSKLRRPMLKLNPFQPRKSEKLLFLHFMSRFRKEKTIEDKETLLLREKPFRIFFCPV